MMRPTTLGPVCKNDHCPSNHFELMCFVRDRKNPGSGIGRVLSIDKNKYSVRFKSGIREVYPEFLERIILENGTIVRIKNSQGVIAGCHSASGALFYKILFASGPNNYQESFISDIVPEGPVEKFRNGDIDPTRLFILKTLAEYYTIAQQSDDLICIRNSRVDLLRHQVGVAHRVVQDFSPRYILADEVGLGKTMEAGLILKELKSRGLVTRTLIVTPASLVTQWQHEMRSKFNENFEIFDSRSESVFRAGNPDKDVFSLHDNVICSIHYAKTRIDEFTGQFWDLVIFDEAHHLGRHLLSNEEVKTTKNYRLATALRDRCGGMLLLTATPMQLDPFEFYSLVELIDPSLFKSFDSFTYYNEEFGPEIKKILRSARESQKILNRYPEMKKDARRLIREGKELFPQYVITDKKRYTDISQLHNFLVIPKLMIRNRKREVFPHLQKRVIKNIAVKYTKDEILLYNEISEFVREEYHRAVEEKNTAIGFLMVIFQKMLTSCKFTLLRSLKKRLGYSDDDCFIHPSSDLSEFDELDETEQDAKIDALIASAARSKDERRIVRMCEKIERFSYDSKVTALIRIVDEIFRKYPNEKVLVFTQFIATQDYVKEKLAKKYSVVTFKGSMSKEEKDENAESFKRHAQVMISTEAGGEGRNFQFCHIIFNFDLPWNPMKVEQRIGRIDRIGQKKNVMVYNFTTIDTIEQRVLEVLYERVGKFQETIGEMEPILGDLERNVKKLIMVQHDDIEKEFDRLEKTIDQKLIDAKDIQEKMQDFFLDKRQFNYLTVDQILGKSPAISPDDLKEFIRSAVKNPDDSGRFEENGKICSIQLPSYFKRAKCTQTKYTGTFDRNYARENENTDFFAFGHDLVTEMLIHYSSDQEPACSVISHRKLKPGWLFIYTIEIETFRSRKVFLPVFINESGKYEEKTGMKCLGLLKEMTSVVEARPQSGQEDPDKYYQTAESVVGKYIRTETKSSEKISGDLIIRERARIERLHQFRCSKLTDDYERERSLLKKISNSRDPGQKKILPAIEGKVKSLRKKIKDLDEEKDAKLEQLKSKSGLKAGYNLYGLARVV
jgi:SNF2 family DNA or RNA helicase